MRDIEQPAEGTTPYECFECGTIVDREERPGHCPECNGAVRNRQTPLE